MTGNSEQTQSFRQRLVWLAIMAVPAVITAGILWVLTHSVPMTIAVPTAIWTALGVAQVWQPPNSSKQTER
ncbi:hypothetical protein C7S18_09775 [Ahniella affigens]|uniref:Uncharacterized protein n=1 Tax=Ahniella affigens TaxID=2021234 RepID=A0A2P1PRI4_9GAMM|nr:hypothetical protein [Ahniella affigens]AVP97467.1 hypothetical protein C7S18_09775 [Ahniella affigens]